MLNKLGKCSKKTPRINQIIIPFLPTVWILGFQMTNLNNVEPWLAQAEPVSAQFPTSLGLTSYNLFLVNHRTKIIHQSAQHANTIMRISKQQMKPLLPSTNWIHNWMTKTDTHATFCMKTWRTVARKTEELINDPALRVYPGWRSLIWRTPDRVSTQNGILLSNNRMAIQQIVSLSRWPIQYYLHRA